MYVVTGVTGQVGQAVAEHLLSEGKNVRVVVRQPEKGQPWADRG